MTRSQKTGPSLGIFTDFRILEKTFFPADRQMLFTEAVAYTPFKKERSGVCTCQTIVHVSVNDHLANIEPGGTSPSLNVISNMND